MEMHDLVKYWKADEIAECLEVSDRTRRELWSCVRLYKDLPRGEAPGEYNYPLSKYGWTELTEEAKLDVNAACEKDEAERKGREEERQEEAAQAAAEAPELYIRYEPITR